MKNSFSLTQGPWYAVATSIESNKPNCFTVTFHCEYKVEGLYEAERNAKVAAAGFELLQALEYLMAIVDANDEPKYVTMQLAPEYFNYARAAIAKARGLIK